MFVKRLKKQSNNHKQCSRPSHKKYKSKERRNYFEGVNYANEGGVEEDKRSDRFPDTS